MTLAGLVRRRVEAQQQRCISREVKQNGKRKSGKKERASGQLEDAPCRGGVFEDGTCELQSLSVKDREVTFLFPGRGCSC